MEVRKGYKQTEVGVIPEDWAVKKLGELVSLRTGPFGSSVHKSDYVNGGIPFINPTHIFNGKLFPDPDITVSSETVARLSEFQLRTNDIIMGRRGEMGRCAVVKEGQQGWLCGSGSMILRPNSKSVPEFLQRVISSPLVIKKIEETSVGSTMINLNQAVVNGLPITYPPIAEQEAIAEALSDADALIESLETLLAKKRQVKQGAMSELLSGKMRLPGFSGEWKKTLLGKLAKIQRGASPRPIDDPIWFDENSSVGWVRISDVTSSGMYLYETTQRLSSLGIEKSRPVEKGSLIMSIAATVGRPIITKIDACIHDGFVVFDNLQVEKHFLYYVLKFIEGDWSKHGQTGSQMNLNTGLINRTEVLLPPTKAEQTAIAEILSDMDAEIRAVEEKLSKARAVKAGMMSELLGGRTRLNRD